CGGGFKSEWYECETCGCPVDENGEPVEGYEPECGHTPGGEKHEPDYVPCQGGFKSEWYECETCGNPVDENGEPVEGFPGDGQHTVVRVPGSAPGCTVGGLTEGAYCSACGEILTEQRATSAVGHSFSEWTTVKEPTVTEEGVEERTCARCGETESRPIPKLSVSFTDVRDTEWYAPYVYEASARGLMVGNGSGAFSPHATGSRAMLVQILYNLAGNPSVTADNPFTDVPGTAWYADAVQWAYENHITSGVGAGAFAPGASVTREQVAQFLYAYAGQPQVSGDLSAFADGDRVSGWAKNAMLWATQNGIISGSRSGDALYLSPRSSASRAEIAKMAVAFAQLMEAAETAD
ncbi:MAG: S-layer homology domain-containing protein, partial [Candidatus Enterenecus sp.]